MTNATLTGEIASALSAWEPMTPEASDRARLLVLDGLAVGAAGCEEPGPTTMAEFVRGVAGDGPSTVIGRPFTTAPHLAARLNGMSMHVLDYEPMWHPANHAVSTTLSPLLALGEALEAEGRGPQGKRLLKSLTKALEVQGRLRLASGQIEVKDLTLHPPGVVGTIAAAVGASDMLELDAPKLVAAIGIAASRSSGLLCNAGTMTKALHCGDAACNGLEAALLAARGFTASLDPLGDPRGYGRSYFGDRFNPSAITAPLATPRTLDPGPAWKFFPSQYATHYCITAALECAKSIPDSNLIREVEVVSADIPYLNRPQPRNGLDGKFSYQYCAAVALLDGHVDMESYSDERRFSDDLIDLLGRVRLRTVSETRGVFTEMQVDVIATLADGRVVSHKCTAPLGNWANPATTEQVQAKAHSLIRSSLGGEAADRLHSLLDHEDDALSIAALMACLSGARS